MFKRVPVLLLHLCQEFFQLPLLELSGFLSRFGQQSGGAKRRPGMLGQQTKGFNG